MARTKLSACYAAPRTTTMIDVDVLEKLVPFILALIGGVVAILWKLGVFKRKNSKTQALTPQEASRMISVKIEDFGRERDKLGEERAKRVDDRWDRIADTAESQQKAIDRLGSSIDTLSHTFVDHKARVETKLEGVDSKLAEILTRTAGGRGA